MCILQKLRNSDDNRLKTFDKITSDPCGANVGKVCKTDLQNAVSSI